MNTNPFIITLTGPSGCGKTFVTNKIIDLGKQLQKEGVDFHPKRFFKFVTRPYRESEIIDKNKNRAIDVKSVRHIPSDCELVYRTYGNEYGLKLNDLNEILENNFSPIVVINDVRVVEELKELFPNQVLSIFIFREIIPNQESFAISGKKRGVQSKSKSNIRFEKAIALYRVFIENIFVYDRVILNVEYDQDNFEDIVSIQTKNLIEGVLNGKIKLKKNIEKSPKLFIVSGNAASGKDDIIKAVNRMGRLQTDIVKKHSSRWQEADDENEIICKFIPDKDLIKKLEEKYINDIGTFDISFTFEKYLFRNEKDLRIQYEEKDNNFKSDCSFYEFCTAKYEIQRMAMKNDIKTGIERFWEIIQIEQETSISNNKNVLLEKDYIRIRDKYFMLNPGYINLESIKSRNKSKIETARQEIKDKSENLSLYINESQREYIVYENNNLYGKPVNYGFDVSKLKEKLKNADKHIVLTASLPNMFKLCKKLFGENNVITAFTYSQISQEEHLRHSDKVMGQAKLKEYADILRYANHIADFDYALIYAETSLINNSGNQKTELVDQMFRLFRVY